MSHILTGAGCAKQFYRSRRHRQSAWRRTVIFASDEAGPWVGGNPTVRTSVASKNQSPTLKPPVARWTRRRAPLLFTASQSPIACACVRDVFATCQSDGAYGLRWGDDACGWALWKRRRRASVCVFRSTRGGAQRLRPMSSRRARRFFEAAKVPGTRAISSSLALLVADPVRASPGPRARAIALRASQAGGRPRKRAWQETAENKSTAMSLGEAQKVIHCDSAMWNR